MPLGLYLHFPFCTNKCAYCDFYKESYAQSLEETFFASLMIETSLAASQLSDQDKAIDSIYIGGGTPSLASMSHLRQWFDLVRTLFDVKSGGEFSFECNPESIDREKLEALAQIGINRPIFGVQSFQPKLLSLLDRKHNPDHSYRAVYLVNALGFSNFGLDLIFGLPTQTTAMLESDVDMLVDLDPPHISCYQLTVEPKTRLADQVERGELKLPTEDIMLSMYQGITEKLRSAGYERYEVSSFAKDGFECQHNLGYWSGKSYLGLGPGAHSFIGGARYSVVSDLAEYTRVLVDGLRPLIEDRSGKSERIAEAIMLSLRTAKGISGEKFRQRFGVALDESLDQAQVELLSKSGHLIIEKNNYRLSDLGLMVVDEIISRVIKQP